MAQKQFSLDINNCGFVDPQKELSAALARENLRDFCIALDMGADPVQPDVEKQMSVYEKALQTHGRAPFVAECLWRGCSPNYVNRSLQKAAINFAGDARDPKIIELLLRRGVQQLDHKYAQLTPLNSLAKNLSAENAPEVAACLRLLLAHGASPNIPDQREMTPLHYVLRNRKIEAEQRRELVELFVGCADLDVDTYRDGEVRKLLAQDYPDLPLPTAGEGRSAEVTVDALLRLLRHGDESKFMQHLDEFEMLTSEKQNQQNATQEHHVELLAEAIKRGTHAAFDVLLLSVVAAGNVNTLCHGNSLVELAAIWGNWRALQQLLAVDTLAVRRQDQLLSTIVRKLDEEPCGEFCDYTKCFYVLLDAPTRVDINETDPSGATPLHYAVKYRNRLAMQELLKRGASIGLRSSVFGDVPIDGMPAELLEEHFDSCITTNDHKPGDNSFEIVIDFKNLMPHAKALGNGGMEGKQQQQHSQQLHDEMTPIAFIADSKEHRHLLQHPLITSFLFLKWHRLSVIFYINFLLYCFFAVAIVVHTILKFSQSEHESITTLFGLFSWCGIGYLVVRELIQFVMSYSSYLCSPINIMELALIVLSVLTVCEPNYDRETQRVVAVFTLLVVALELCMLVGSLPVLSISTHMLMLRAVTQSFLKSFTLYSIFVVTFSLCFYLLFGKPELDANGVPQANENGDFNKFSSPIAAVIKTIVMLTGEFDAGDIDFDSLYSYLVFLLFVFLMTIVLFNLLNGLAVSDTQAIKAQAELNGSICRTNLLVRYEEVLTGRSGSTSFIVTHEPFRTICRRLMNIYPNYIAGRQIAIQPNDGNKVLIPVANVFELQRLSMARANAVRNSQTKFQPLTNQMDGGTVDGDLEGGQKRVLDPPLQLLACCCTRLTGKCSEMDSRTVKMAMAVIDRKSTAKRERQRLQVTERRLQSIEEKLEKMFELLQDIQSK